jgi:hypothetical protein
MVDGPSLYVYARANPARFVDPGGMQSQEDNRLAPSSGISIDSSGRARLSYHPGHATGSTHEQAFPGRTDRLRILDEEKYGQCFIDRPYGSLSPGSSNKVRRTPLTPREDPRVGRIRAGKRSDFDESPLADSQRARQIRSDFVTGLAMGFAGSFIDSPLGIVFVSGHDTGAVEETRIEPDSPAQESGLRAYELLSWIAPLFYAPAGRGGGGGGAGGGSGTGGAGSGNSLSPRAARRKAMRKAGIPTSQQPKSQESVTVWTKDGEIKAGRQYTYEVPTKGGGTKEMSVQHSLTDDVEGHCPHWEAGDVKSDNRTDSIGRPRLKSTKSKVDE